MGNQLTGEQQSGQVLNAVLGKLPQLMHDQQTAPANSKSLSKLRNSKFIRGDEGYNPVDSQSKLNLQNDSKPTPIRGFNADANVPAVGPALQDSQAGFDPIRQASLGQIKTPTARKQAKQISKPFNIFQQLFGGDYQQTDRRLRSSSASHVSMSNSNRKMILLESNAQVSQRKVDQLTKTIESLQNNLRTSESRALLGEQNLQKLQSRTQYLESQVKSYQQQIQNLNSQLGQRSSILYQKDRQIGELELQVHTLRSQIQLLQNRLKEYATREERKDREIREISSAKFELNSLKIRLENNLKVAEGNLEEKTRKIGELDDVIGRKNKEIAAGQKQINELEHVLQNLRHELKENAARHQTEQQSLHSAIRDHLMNIDQNETRILQQTHKIDKLYYQQIENQSIIAKLKDNCAELQFQKAQAQHEASEYRAQLQTMQASYNSQKDQHLRQREINEKILAEYSNAKKVGQKQIQFLQNKLEEAGKEKQQILEELQATKLIAIQRNKLFERSIIYDLKQENDRLWNKLIEKSNIQIDLGNDDPNFWKIKFDQYKAATQKVQPPNVLESSMQDKSQLEQRFVNFLRKLEGVGPREGIEQEQEKQPITRDISSRSLAELEESVAFYKQKCNQLEKIVEQHIILNKNLRDQLEKYNNYELAFQVYRAQLEETKSRNNQLNAQNFKLKQALNVEILMKKIAEVGELLQQINQLNNNPSSRDLISQTLQHCLGVLSYCSIQCEKLRRLR